MLRPRVIPCLLLLDGGLVKTQRFAKPNYVGDPVNVARIFNELEVDELVVLDIGASRQGRDPDFRLVAELASQCFMPLTYGGGVRTLEAAQRLLSLGVEKICINSAAVENPALVRATVDAVGAQSVVGSMDVKRRWRGGHRVVTPTGRVAADGEPERYAERLVELGVGEIFLNSVDRDGMMDGFDLELVRRVTRAVPVPVVACGGAGSLEDLRAVIVQGGASAAAAGSLFVYRNRNRSVLVNFPSPAELDDLLGVERRGAAS